MTAISEYLSTPGEILLEDFLEPLGIFQGRLAGAIGVPASAVADIVAGIPTGQDEVLDNMPIPVEVAGRHPHAFLLKVNGTSMNRVLPEGCYALVDPDRKGSVIENKPYAVKINGDMATVKRLRRLAAGWLLVPDSYDATWQPIEMHLGDPLFSEMRIIGEVVWYTLPLDWSF